MTIRNFYEILDKKYHFNSQDEWDNSGIITNNLDGEINNPILCLDINLDVVEFAIKNNSNLIVSHHPIYINSDDLKLKKVSLIWKLINEHNITLIAIHTCFDKNKYGTNYQILKKIGCDDIYQSQQSDYLFFGTLKQKTNILDCLNQIKLKLNLDYLIYQKNKLLNFNKPKKFKIGVVGGSGSADSFNILQKDKCDIFITSEIKWHIWNYFDWDKNSFILIDVPHSIEKIFILTIKKLFKEINFIEFNPICLKIF